MSRTGSLTFKRSGERHSQAVEHEFSHRWRITLDTELRKADVLESVEVVLDPTPGPVPSKVIRFAGGPCEVTYWVEQDDGVSVVVGFDPPLEPAR